MDDAVDDCLTHCVLWEFSQLARCEAALQVAGRVVCVDGLFDTRYLFQQ